MDLTVSKKDLLKLLAPMQGVASTRSTMPALSTVLLSADGDSLRISATCLHLSLSGSIGADVKKPGAVALPAKDLLERVKAMADGPIHIVSIKELSATTLKSVGTARKYTLRGMPGEDFPALPAPAEGAPTLALEVEVLQQLIAKTHFSISTDETRAHLNSALFEWDGDVVRMVTTDGHRLSKMEVKVSGRQASATMLIPLKAITELRRMLDEETEKTITIVQSGSSAFFIGSSMTFAAKLTDATFPPYQQVIPKSSSKNVRVPRVMFADAIKAIGVASAKETSGIRALFGTGKITIEASSADGGDGSDECSAEYAGPDHRIGFNSKYFLDVLGALGDETVSVDMSGELDPVIIRPDGDSGFTSVVMPMRI